jgi:hypothetical protein
VSETGQPGAATPGEHGDGTGQQDDLPGSDHGWAPSAAGWSTGGDAAGQRDVSPWRRSEPASGWATSSSRHGDLPTPLTDHGGGPGRSADTEPPSRLDGQSPGDGARRAGEESPVARLAPVSALPARTADGDRVTVPLQRPAGEQRSGVPSSAPPAMRGASAAANFEAPPGAHAPVADRPDPEATASGWADRFGSDEPDPRAHPPAESGYPSLDDRPSRLAGEDRAGHPAEARRAGGERADERGAPPEPGWAGPNWNRPSWSGGWAPPWAREESGGPASRRSQDEDEPRGRRVRADRAADWGPEPPRGYAPEPARRYEPQPEVARAYEPEPARGHERETGRPYQPMRAEAARPYELGHPEPAPQQADRPSWAGGRPVSAPAGAPASRPDAPASADAELAAVLPQRVPAEPDVPVVPEPPAMEPTAETPQLARIATHLRRDDEPAPPQDRPEGFDVNAILDAVRGVAGVRDASLRRTPAGAHSLRLDLADGADPAEVSRIVARMLQERMGLAAAPQNVPGMPNTPPPPVRRRSARRRADNRFPDARGEGRAPEGQAAAEAPTRAERRPDVAGDPPRRRRQATAHRGRPGTDESASPAAASASPTTLGAAYTGQQLTTTESAPSRPLDTGGVPGPRVVIDHVQVSTFGLEANVEVRLLAGAQNAVGYATGPAVDGYGSARSPPRRRWTSCCAAVNGNPSGGGASSSTRRWCRLATAR